MINKAKLEFQPDYPVPNVEAEKLVFPSEETFQIRPKCLRQDS